MSSPDFDPHYWLAKAYVDQPGHTDWDRTTDVSEQIAEARDILADSDPASREGRAAAILDDVLDGVPAPDDS